MPSLHQTASLLRTSTGFLLLITGGSGFLLGAIARPSWQASVESAQTLAGLVSYPLHNSFHAYHVKLWTIVNQLAALGLALGCSERTLSILLTGVMAALSYAAIGLCVFAVSRNAFWGIAAPFLVDFTTAGSAMAVNYPMDFMGTPHTYGIAGLAWSLLTLALISLGHYSAGGFFLGLAPAVHPALGAWCWLIVSVAWVWNDSGILVVFRRFWKPVAAGALVSVSSLLLQFYWMRPVLPRVDADTQARFVSVWVEFFDFHRRPVDTSLLGVQLSVAAVVAGIYLLLVLDGERDSAAVFMIKAIVVTAAFALLGAVVSHLPPSTVPQTILMLMPTRLFLLSNLAFIATLVGLLGRFPSVWVRINALLLVLLVATGDAKTILHALVLSSAGFLIWKSVALPGSRLESAAGQRWLSILIGIALLWIAGKGVVERVKTATLYHAAMFDRSNNAVLAAASKTDGVLVIGQQCCSLTQIKTRRPLLVEATALDQLPYVPEAGPDMNAALKAVYGVDLLNLPEVLRVGGFNGDLTPVMKPLWEARRPEEWKSLGAAFGFTSILANPGWTLQLPETARDAQYVLYRIPAG